MAKTVAWKLDFLMKVTGTSNSELARRLGFDASYISRVRHGKRGLPPEQPFIEPASALFAKLVRDNYQRRALAANVEAPLVAFNIEEPRMASAVWEYLDAGANVARGTDADALLARVADGLGS